MTTEKKPAIEFSRPIQVTSLEAGDNRFRIAPDGDEQAALARRFDLNELVRFSAEFLLKPVAGNVQVRVEGRIEAEVEQPCVVTLEPVRDSISHRFHCTFSTEAAAEEQAELDVGWDEDDPDEPIIDGIIDIGEVAAERLGLEINPFPRAAHAEFNGYASSEGSEPAESVAAKPFAALKNMLDRKD